MQTLQNHQLNPIEIQKYENELFIPPVYEPQVVQDPNTGEITHHYRIKQVQFQQQILPSGFQKTTVWGYEGLVKDPEYHIHRSAPGATFEAVRGIPIIVEWVNRLAGPHLFAVDPTLHWANPNNMPMNPPKPWPDFPPGFKKAQYPVPTVPHLHGGEVQSFYDGNPEAWFTHDGKEGPNFTTNRYVYPNKQQATTLWYHDHALGITRLNVYAGLAGFYLLRDPENLLDNEATTVLPTGEYEIPLVIQDRIFNCDGSLFFTKAGNNPDIHPYWAPEFLGNTIMVNGRVWPNLNIERRRYRFRILNGSNARFYNLKLSNGQSFIQIGTDGGYLESPVELKALLIAPGERADVIIDFSNLRPGEQVIMENDAPAPYPGGAVPDENTVGKIMRFKVPIVCHKPVSELPLPNLLNTIPKLTAAQVTRTLTLNEVIGPAGPTELLLDGKRYDDPITELPRVGSTEIWELVNQTEDTHPIHLHLVQFQLLDRQDIDTGVIIEPEPKDKGWKDTIRANPRQITRIIVRFAPQDANASEVQPGVNLYPFDPTSGPGYVWHCHILDHEDNEMMRPYKVTI